MTHETVTRINSLVLRLPALSPSQVLAIDSIVRQFEKPTNYARNPSSDLFSPCVLLSVCATFAA